jgi:membrane-associated phospholipid phosphatase
MNTRPAVLSLLVCATMASPAAAQYVSPKFQAAQASPAPSQTPAPTLTPAPAEVAPDTPPQPGIVTREIDWSGEARRLTAPGFGQIFRDLGDDFRRLPSRENALLLGIGAGLAGLSSPHDSRATASIHARDGELKGFLGPGAWVGNFYVNLGASFATYAVGRATGSAKTAVLGADLIRAQLLAQGTTQGIKYIAGRTRPNGESRSFPSGHTSSAFATATVLQRHYGWKVGIPAYAAAAYVGASRLNANKHYLSDVAFGAALGIVAGRTVTMGIGGTKFALAPIAAKGGVGIGFTRIPKQ